MSAMIAIYELQDTKPLVDLFIFSYMRTCAAYDATVLSIGFDEIRVRYRQQRRVLLREVILQKLFGKSQLDYIQSHAKTEIPSTHRLAFIEDTLEDLQQMDISRITGLGITPIDLEVWRKNQQT